MPRITCADRQYPVDAGTNLLDALLGADVAVPYGCRAGACHSCMVRCVAGELLDDMPDALDAGQRAQGWRLACQCRVAGDVQLELYDPGKDGVPARIEQLAWLSDAVLRLRVLPERPLRYAAGEHLLLWTECGVGRPYSLASLPGEDPWLEFHLDCHRSGAFCDVARTLQTGQILRLGARHAGALHYDGAWVDQPLLLLARGTGLAPLWSILREALRQGHRGPIHLLHVGGSAGHYLAEPLRTLARQHAQLTVNLLTEESLPPVRMARQTIALICGGAAFIEKCGRQLFMAGVPRGQVFADAFLSRGGEG